MIHELAPRVRQPSDIPAFLVYWLKSFLEVTMSFLSAAASCPSASRGSDRERPLADDIPVIDAENAEGSSRAVGPLSRESEQPAELSLIHI